MMRMRLVRLWLPVAIIAGGIALIVATNASESGIEGGALLISAGLSVWLLNWLFRLGVRGDRERQSEDDARAYVTELYRRVPVLDSGARGATITFAQKEIGDVHLTWENEAHLEVEESGGKLAVVYPSASIRAEPPVAVVDANVRKKGTRPAAEAYLKLLYTDEAQDIIARHHYRPSDPKAFERNKGQFPGLPNDRSPALEGVGQSRGFCIAAIPALWI